MQTINNKFIALATTLFATPLIAAAEETTKTTAGNSYNVFLIALVSLMVILLFAIAALGNVLKQLANVYRDKLKKDKGTGGTIKTMLLLIAFSIPSVYAFAQEATDAAAEIVAPSSPYISGIPKTEFYFLMGFIGFEFIIVFVLLLIIRLMVRLISNKPELVPQMKAVIKKPFLDRFNKSVAVTNEEVIVLDHDYDGIRELDNDLPPWWRYMFIASILVSVVYLWYYHMADGPNQIEEYTAQVEKGEQQKAPYLAKSANNVDENTVTMVLDQTELGAAQILFQNSCAACHAKDGGGGVGPNLTDAYWMHGGTIKDVFKTIKYGVPEKGMKSWKDDFSPKQIAGIASYIKSLKGTKPEVPKEKQGELLIEGGDKALDSLSTETQPATVPVDRDTVPSLRKIRKQQNKK